VVEFIEAASREEVAVLADEIAGNARKLMDLAVCDWREEDEWKDLDGEALLREAGYAFGAAEVWSGEHFLHVVETPFGPCDLQPYQGELGPKAPLAGFPAPARGAP